MRRNYHTLFFLDASDIDNDQRKFNLLKKYTSHLILTLRSRMFHRVGLVTFKSDVHRVLLPLTYDLGETRNALQNLRLNEDFSNEDQELNASLSNMIKSDVFAGDGKQLVLVLGNIPKTDSAIYKHAMNLRADGLETFGIGVGPSFFSSTEELKNMVSQPVKHHTLRTKYRSLLNTADIMLHKLTSDVFNHISVEQNGVELKATTSKLPSVTIIRNATLSWKKVDKDFNSFVQNFTSEIGKPLTTTIQILKEKAIVKKGTAETVTKPKSTKQNKVITESKKVKDELDRKKDNKKIAKMNKEKKDEKELKKLKTKNKPKLSLDKKKKKESTKQKQQRVKKMEKQVKETKQQIKKTDANNETLYNNNNQNGTVEQIVEKEQEEMKKDDEKQQIDNTTTPFRAQKYVKKGVKTGVAKITLKTRKVKRKEQKIKNGKILSEKTKNKKDAQKADNIMTIKQKKRQNKKKKRKKKKKKQKKKKKKKRCRRQYLACNNSTETFKIFNESTDASSTNINGKHEDIEKTTNDTKSVVMVNGECPVDEATHSKLVMKNGECVVNETKAINNGDAVSNGDITPNAAIPSAASVPAVPSNPSPDNEPSGFVQTNPPAAIATPEKDSSSAVAPSSSAAPSKPAEVIPPANSTLYKNLDEYDNEFEDEPSYESYESSETSSDSKSNDNHDTVMKKKDSNKVVMVNGKCPVDEHSHSKVVIVDGKCVVDEHSESPKKLTNTTMTTAENREHSENEKSSSSSPGNYSFSTFNTYNNDDGKPSFESYSYSSDSSSESDGKHKKVVKNKDTKKVVMVDGKCPVDEEDHSKVIFKDGKCVLNEHTTNQDDKDKVANTNAPHASGPSNFTIATTSSGGDGDRMESYSVSKDTSSDSNGEHDKVVESEDTKQVVMVGGKCPVNEATHSKTIYKDGKCVLDKTTKTDGDKEGSSIVPDEAMKPITPSKPLSPDDIAKPLAPAAVSQVSSGGDGDRMESYTVSTDSNEDSNGEHDKVVKSEDTKQVVMVDGKCPVNEATHSKTIYKDGKCVLDEKTKTDGDKKGSSIVPDEAMKPITPSKPLSPDDIAKPLAPAAVLIPSRAESPLKSKDNVFSELEEDHDGDITPARNNGTGIVFNDFGDADARDVTVKFEDEYDNDSDDNDVESFIGSKGKEEDEKEITDKSKPRQIMNYDTTGTGTVQSQNNYNTYTNNYAGNNYNNYSNATYAANVPYNSFDSKQTVSAPVTESQIVQHTVLPDTAAAAATQETTNKNAYTENPVQGPALAPSSYTGDTTASVATSLPSSIPATTTTTTTAADTVSAAYPAATTISPEATVNPISIENQNIVPPIPEQISTVGKALGHLVNTSEGKVTFTCPLNYTVNPNYDADTQIRDDTATASSKTDAGNPDKAAKCLKSGHNGVDNVWDYGK